MAFSLQMAGRHSRPAFRRAQWHGRSVGSMSGLAFGVTGGIVLGFYLLRSFAWLTEGRRTTHDRHYPESKPGAIGADDVVQRSGPSSDTWFSWGLTSWRWS
jgi:hypothetical protein